MSLPTAAPPLATRPTLPASLRAAEDFLAARRFTARSWYGDDGVVHRLPTCSGPGCRRGAVLSYRFPPEHPLRGVLAARSYVYDDALAMVVHTLRGDRTQARSLGQTLAALTDTNGHLGFSFTLESPAAYDSRYQRAGTTAWAGYALALYEARTGDAVFGPVARRIAEGLLAARVNTPGDPRDGLVVSGRGTWAGTPRTLDPEGFATECVTEHQIDAYFLLATLGSMDPSGRYHAAAEALAGHLVDALWIDAEGRFAVAVTTEGRVADRALDAAGAWGVLFLLARGDGFRAQRALDYTLASFATRVDGLQGFAPYAGPAADYPGQDLSREFFSEGTAGVGLALVRTGRRAEAETLVASLREVQRRGGGGVLYALPGATDFPDVPAAAPTAWLWLLEQDLAAGAPTGFWTAASGPAATGRSVATGVTPASAAAPAPGG